MEEIKKLFERFQNYLMTEKCVASNTLEAYNRDIGQFLKFIERNYSVNTFDQITSQHTKDFLLYMRRGMGLGAKSASRKLSALKTLANYLSRYHDIMPFTQGVSFPQLPKQLPKNLTQEQIQELFKAADLDQTVCGQRNKVMLCLLYVCGIRVSELVAMKISNINFQERLLLVDGKGGKQRVVPLPTELIVFLQAYLERIRGHFLTRSSKALHTDYLFPVFYAGSYDHITRQAFWKIVKDISKKSGLVHNVSPHVLRHSLATHMLKRGANLRHLQALLGHEKINTVQIYTHMEISQLRELYDKYHLRA